MKDGILKKYYNSYSNLFIMKITNKSRIHFNQHFTQDPLILTDLHRGKGISARLNMIILQINGLALQERD